MRHNANLKWQECYDRGFRAANRDATDDTTPPCSARGGDADDKHDDATDVIAAELSRL